MGQFHSGGKAASYRACCFKEEVCGAPMRLLVLEGSSLKGKARASLEKRRRELEPEIKKAEKKTFLCEADAAEEIRRFGKQPCSELFQCSFRIVENSFRELKSPSMASVIYLKNPERIKALSMLLSLSLLIRAIIQYRMREGLKEFQKENPAKKLRAGWGGRVLEKPTYRLLYEHSVNCYFEKEERGVYSYAWPSVEAEERVEPLLKLLKITLDKLI